MKKNRCLLFVPGIKEKLSHIGQLKNEPDAYIIDLEDSIKACDKERALSNTIEYLKSKEDDRTVYIRVNKERWEKELEKLSSYKFAGIMFPKAETYTELRLLKDYQRCLEVIALIETPLGIVNMKDICADGCASALAFGGEDYLSTIGVPYSHDAVLYAKSKLVTYASAYNMAVYDTIYANVRDLNGMEEETLWSKNLGFTGKLAIHPQQIPIIHNIFKGDNIQWYKYLVSQFEQTPNGVLEIDGRVYERPHIDLYRKKIGEYEGAGGHLK